MALSVAGNQSTCLRWTASIYSPIIFNGQIFSLSYGYTITTTSIGSRFPKTTFREYWNCWSRTNPIRVDNIEEYAVVREQYTEHKEILRNSVMNWSRDGYNSFVMESSRAVEEAVEQGATRVEESNLVLGL